MEELHKIIQSLSKDEKREFKLNASVYKNSKESNHIKLFDFLEKMKEYDSRAVQKKIKEKAFGKQFAITKQKLWDSLLDSLAHSDRNVTLRRQISRDIDQIDILLDHACFKLARRKILHALKNAMAIDHHVSIMKLCHQYQFVIIDSFLRNEPYDHKYAYQIPYDSTIKFQYHLHFFYANLLLKEVVLHSKYDPEKGDKAKHVQEIIRKYLEIEVPEKYQTIQVRYNRFMSYNLLNHFAPDSYDTLGISKEMVNEFDRNPVHLKENIKSYISVLFSLVNAYKEAGDWKNFAHYLEKLRNAVINEQTVYEHYFISVQTLRMQGCYYMDRMEDFVPLYRESLDYLQEHSAQEHNYVNSSFFILATKLFFTQGDYKKALETCNVLRNTMNKETFETTAAIYVHFLFIHLALGNPDVVAHHTEHYRKHLEKWDYADEIDQILLRFFIAAADHIQAKAVRADFRKAWEELQPYRETGKFSLYFECMNFSLWLKA